jgi:hypothetical protein
MKKPNALARGLGTFVLVSGLLCTQQALANTAGGATIHNYATLTFTGDPTGIKAAVNVAVQTVAATPSVVKSTADETVPSYATANYTLTVTSTSNGADTFNLALSSTDVNTAGAPSKSFLLNGTPVTSLTLGASVTSQPSTAGVIYIPAGSEANLTVNSTIKVGANLYTISAVTPGTVASTNTSTGVHSNEVPTALTLSPVGAAPAITAGSVAAGVQVGQQVTLVEQVVASAPATSTTTATHTVSFTATSTATDLAGANVVYSSASNGTNTVTTVIIAATSLNKFVRNTTRASGNASASGSVTCNGNTYYAAGVTTKPGDTLEYCLKASVATGQPTLTGAKIVDDVPPYTTYVANSTSLNGASVADVGGASQLSTANGGLTVQSPGATSAGEILPGETATVVLQVTVQ